MTAEFADHLHVDHSKDEYARGEVTTNTVEGYFSIFKRRYTIAPRSQLCRGTRQWHGLVPIPH